MTTHLPCPYVSLPVGCTDPKCLHLHPPGYRTRCRNTAKPGGCQNQYCKYYHDAGDTREVRQGWQEARIGGVEKRGDWGQQRCSSQGSTGFVCGLSLRSCEEPPLYEKRNVTKDRDLWLEGQGYSGDDERRRKGLAGHSGGSYGPRSELEGDLGNHIGRKWKNSCDRNLVTQVNFDQHQMIERNGSKELMRNRECRSWEGKEENNDWFSKASFHIKNEVKIEEGLETLVQKDEYNQSLGNERQITERENFSIVEDQDYVDHQNSLNANYNCSGGPQGFWISNRAGFVGTKPNIFQQNEGHSSNARKRNFGAADSACEAESDKCSSKKLKEDIDLRLEKTNVETFDFPDKHIGLLIGRQGSTIRRLQTLCSPAVITVPQVCDARGFRVVRIEGYRMQREKAKSVIYKMFKERGNEHFVEFFKRFVEDPIRVNEENKGEGNASFKISHQDPGSRVEIEALKTKLSCMEREKCDLQNTISELLDGKYKLQGQVCKLSSEVEGQRGTIKSLELENKNFRMEKDFIEAADDSWKNISMEQTKQLNFQIETLARELVKNNYELKARDDMINDLEQTSETRLKEIQMLQSEMERDFVQCDKCEEKFRSNELLRRHQRFKH